MKRAVLPQLGTDLRSRQQVGNRIRIQDNRHRTRDSRKIDLGLAMELLVALILSKTDSPDRVDSHCVVVARHPNNYASSRMSDIQAEYAQSKPNERYFIMAEVSARNRTDTGSYRGQLEQAYVHAKKLQQENPDQIVYALIVNTGKIGEKFRITASLFAIYRRIQELTDTSMVRIVPFSGHDLAYGCATTATGCRRCWLTRRTPGFIQQRAVGVSNGRASVSAMFDDKERETGWMAQLFCDTVTADSSLNFKPSSDDGGFKSWVVSEAALISKRLDRETETLLISNCFEP